MTEKMWYNLLLEDNYIMEETDHGQDYIKCRVERASPTVDWEHCWRLARLSGLGPENMTFLFKLLHQILPTQERVARTKPCTRSSCKMPGCHVEVENLEHSLIFCQSNDDVGLLLLELLRGITPALQPQSLLRLEFHVEPELELPVVFFISTVLNSLWNLRQSGNRVQKYLVRSQMEAKINLLRETRHSATVVKLEEFTLSMFH